MIEALLGECVGPLGRLGLEPAGALCMQELSDKGHTSPGQLVGQLGCCFRGGGGGCRGGSQHLYRDEATSRVASLGTTS